MADNEGDVPDAPEPYGDPEMKTTQRNAVTLTGVQTGQPMMFAHGYGCDQNMWRFVAPEFAQTHRIVLFDHVGSGRSDLTAYDDDRYSTLDGYAQDVLEILHDNDLDDVVFVGHSVSAMIGLLAAAREPARFDKLVMIGPSPCYIDDGDYRGGFSKADLEGMLEALDSNYLGWSSATAPVIMGNPQRPELAAELTNSFCATDPEIARKFAHVCFLSDNRDDLARCPTPALVMQCTDDVIAPSFVGEYVHRHLPQSTFVAMNATGHCPNLSAPEETTAAIKSYLSGGR